MQDREINMTVSPICLKNGAKVAYVAFTDGEREAEGEIPTCKITRGKGVDEEEAEHGQAPNMSKNRAAQQRFAKDSESL